MIHPTAQVTTQKVGLNTTIWQFVVILEKAVIGSGCNINCHTFIENDVVIGNNVTLKSGVYLWDGITLEDDVFIGPNATFTNDKVPKSKRHPQEYERIVVKKNASIGANATIIGPVTIGEYCLVGAGSVLTKHTQPYSLWLGNPAKHKGYVTKDNKILSLNLMDNDGSQYEFINGEIVKKHD
ncbi:acyltransferase [Daejeonella sp.]|uniref:acyltransferase n=1 Tax=Daejeonella sp. TaxID=2805397 RepID=UPI002BE33370|nr:acyltransferase [Daejeonella sp.]HQT58843.1 acyltransferase [Daejeonella sp.]